MKTEGRGYAFVADVQMDEQIRQYAQVLNLTRAEACRSLIKIGLSTHPHEGAILGAQLAAANGVRIWMLQQVHESLAHITKDIQNAIKGQAFIRPHERPEPPEVTNKVGWFRNGH